MGTGRRIVRTTFDRTINRLGRGTSSEDTSCRSSLVGVVGRTTSRVNASSLVVRLGRTSAGRFGDRVSSNGAFRIRKVGFRLKRPVGTVNKTVLGADGKSVRMGGAVRTELREFGDVLHDRITGMLFGGWVEEVGCNESGYCFGGFYEACAEGVLDVLYGLVAYY